MNETNDNRSLWCAADSKAFFLVANAELLPPGSYSIRNGEGQSVGVTEESLAAFAVDPAAARVFLETSLAAHAEAVVARNKELELVGVEKTTPQPVDREKIRAYLLSKEAKTSVRSMAAALRKAADKIERSPGDIEKYMGELVGIFMGEMMADEKKEEKNDKDRKTRIGMAVKDSIANALKDLNKK